MSFIEKLKEKPAAVRTQVTLLVALLVTGIIAVVWFSTLPARFSNVSEPQKVLVKENEEKMSFGKLFSEAGGQMAAIIESAKSLKDNFQPASDEEGARSTPEYEKPFTIDAAATTTFMTEEQTDVVEEEEHPEMDTNASASSSREATVDMAPRTILIGTTTSNIAE